MRANRSSFPIGRVSWPHLRAALAFLSKPVPGVRRVVGGASGAQAGPYVRTVFQNLAIFRFASFAMGVGLVFTVNLEDRVSPQLLTMVITVGLYNVIRVVWPFNPTGRPFVVQGLMATTDVTLGIALVIMTNGLDSGFLIYSLAPILAVSLLMDLRSAVVFAGASALSVSGAYIAGGLDLGKYPSILNGNFLVFSLLYGAVCLLVAALPFIVNLNWQRHVRAESVDAERRRLRREVHDNVAQTLAFLSLKVKRAEERAADRKVALSRRDVGDIASSVERAYLAVRDYLDGTEEPIAADGTFGASLNSVVMSWSRDTAIPANVVIDGVDARLSAATHQQLIQIAREALANVAKHATARRVAVTWRAGPGGLLLRIRDDGRGFAATPSRGHGLSIMNERAEMIGATVSVTSSPGEGTEVEVSCPGDKGEGNHG